MGTATWKYSRATLTCLTALAASGNQVAPATSPASLEENAITLQALAYDHIHSLHFGRSAEDIRYLYTEITIHAALWAAEIVALASDPDCRSGNYYVAGSAERSSFNALASALACVTLGTGLPDSQRDPDEFRIHAVREVRAALHKHNYHQALTAPYWSTCAITCTPCEHRHCGPEGHERGYAFSNLHSTT